MYCSQKSFEVRGHVFVYCYFTFVGIDVDIFFKLFSKKCIHLLR